MAKKVKNSEYNVIGQDPITEMIHGKGSVHLRDVRIVVRDGGCASIETPDGQKTLPKVGFWGVALDTPNMVNDDGNFQMWDCELIIIPHKKYRTGFKGSRADQILVSGCLGDPEMWEEEIFDRDECD